MTLELKAQIVKILIITFGIIVIFLGFYRENILNKVSTKKEAEQDSKINYLLQLAESKSDSKTLDIFKTHLQNKFNLSYDDFLKLIEESKTQNNSLLEKALAFYLSEDFNESTKYFELVLNSSKNWKELVIANVYTGHTHFFNLNYDGNKAKDYFKNAITIFNKNKTNDPFFINLNADSYLYLGIFYKHKGKKGKAKENYNQALGLYLSLNKSFPEDYNLKIAGVYQNLFSLNNYSNTKGASFKHLKNAYKYKQKAYNREGNDENILSLMNTIVSMVNYYSNIKDFKKVKSSFYEGKKYLKLCVNKNEDRYTFMSANLNSNYGFSVKTKAEINKSSDDIKNAFKLMKKADSLYRMLIPFKNNFYKLSFANNLHNLGITSEYLRDTFFDAEQFYFEAISNREELLKTNENFVNSKSLGDSYLALARFYDKVSPSPEIKKEFAEKSLNMYNPYVKDYDSLKEWIRKAEEILNK